MAVTIPGRSLETFMGNPPRIPIGEPNPLHAADALIRSTMKPWQGAALDQLQHNGTDGICQMRARIYGDDNLYRVILAPLDADIRCGGLPIAALFQEPIV